MPEQVCVHLIDDDEAVRRTLSYALAEAGFATRIYASADQFIAATAPGDGCIVTDVRMPGMDGVALVKHLRAASPAPAPVIVMSGHADVAMALDAMKAGAADFLQKPFRASRLVECVREAITSRARPGPDAAERRALSMLSPRQRDVLEGIVAGKLNKSIAHELGLSVRTVEGYRAEIMSKTGARRLSDLVRMAVLAGF